MASDHRLPVRAVWLILLLLVTGLVPGCTLLATGLWVINPNDIKAEYNGLVGRRVAVICRPTSGLHYENADAGQELAEAVALLLKQHVKRIDVVPQKEVNDWLDNNELKSPVELGKALKADAVVALDLERFSVYQGPTIYQGQAQLTVAVHDVDSGESKTLPPITSVYPPKNGVPVDIAEEQFRAKFIGILSGQIARHFYPYDSRSIDDQFYRE